MYQWTEKTLRLYLKTLKWNNTRDISGLLFTLSSISTKPVPTGNAEITSYLEQLIEDRRWTIINGSIPLTYGELRWLAARVLACEYAYQGIKTPIILKDVAKPIEESEYYKILAQHENKSIYDLIEDGVWPTTTEIIRPQDYCEWCSQEAVEKRRREQESEE